MALSAHARKQLKAGLASAEAADDVADIVDAGNGTMTGFSFRRTLFAMGNRRAADLFETAVNAGSAIDGYTQRRLAIAVGDAGVAREIADALSA